MSDRRCFVLMPFAPALREVYENVYRPVCENLDIHCWRVDELARPGSITRDIVEGIIDADILIADLTSKNPNVFYELGIAHAVGNKTIMTAQSVTDVPFDVASYRVIVYEPSIGGARTLSLKLRAAITELLQAGSTANNPFQDFGRTQIRVDVKIATPLAKHIDPSLLTKAVRKYLSERGILTIEDLPKLDFDDLLAEPGIGRYGTAKLVALLIHTGIYPDPAILQHFVLRHGVRVGHWLSRWES